MSAAAQADTLLIMSDDLGWETPFGDQTHALICVYGRDENATVSAEIRAHVEVVRACQPHSYPPGLTPWPQAPKDAKIITPGDAR